VQLLPQERDRANGPPDSSPRHLHRAVKIILEARRRCSNSNGILSVSLLPIDTGCGAGAPPSIGLMRAATWDYILGAFCDFLSITEIEIKIHQAHARNAGDLEKNTELQSIVFHLIMLKAISERVYPEFEREVWKRIKAWIPEEWIDGILPSARKSLQGLNTEELKAHLTSELLGVPYGDLETERNMVWNALGVEWRLLGRTITKQRKRRSNF
jgi:hypothetical protein